MKPRWIGCFCIAVLISLVPLFSMYAGGTKRSKEPEVTVSVVPPSEAIPSPEEANIDWKQFRGETVSVLFSRHPWQEAVEPFIPEFEKLTGMKVKLVKLPEAEYITKLPADLTAGTFAFDVFMSQYYDSPKFDQERWAAEISQFLNDETLTDPDWYDWDDFFPGAQDIATVGDTYFDKIAMTAEAILLIYREDVYKELGLSVPTTFDELLENEKIISEKTNMSGITLRGGAALWHPLYGVIRSYGGGYFDSDWNPIINHPKSIEGAKMYAELCKYTPKGVTSYDWDEINTAMLAGEAAMFMDSSVIYPRLQDPEKSTVVGKIKVAPYPKGPNGRIAHCHYWSVSIAESSKKKEAAWLFLQWVTSKDIMYKAGLSGILPPRASVWNEAAFSETFPEDFIYSVQETLKTGVISPAHSRFFEAMDILRAEYQKVLLGEKDVESALDFTQKEWEKIMADWKANG